MNKISNKVYYDPQILQEERSDILKQSWILVALSSQLPRPNTEWLFEIAGHSILLTRDAFGKTHACRNTCLHRGSKLRKPKNTILSRFTSWKGDDSTSIICPYHGWGYDLSGKLCHIKNKQNFFGTVDNSLHTFQTYEKAGLIWICLGKPRYSAEFFLKNIIEPLEKYKLEEMEPIEANDFYFPINWKLCLENSLDYYHVSQVHQNSVNAHVIKAPNFDDLHWHNLQTLHIAPYSWSKWFDRICSPDYGFSDFEISSLHKYLVFPNLVINVLPYQLTIMQYWPIDERNCVMRYRFCRRRNYNPIEQSRSYLSWLASRWILYEDVRIYRSVQEGIENSNQSSHFLHNQEISIAHFHQRIMEWRQENDLVKSIQ